jgi:hypothetical protein
MKIAHARNRLKFEDTQKLPDMRMCLEGDLMSEIDEERSIAGALKLSCLGEVGEHARKLYAGGFALRRLDVV